MLTLPNNNTTIVRDIDPRLTHELHRLLSERQAAKARGYWPSVKACDKAIEVLMRIVKGTQP